MLLEQHIVSSCCLESISEITGNDDIHNVNKLDIYTKLVEPQVQIIHESRSELTLNVPDLVYLDTTDVVSDRLFTLLLEQFFKFVGSQIVQEFLAVSLSSIISSDVESDTYVN